MSLEKVIQEAIKKYEEGQKGVETETETEKNNTEQEDGQDVQQDVDETTEQEDGQEDDTADGQQETEKTDEDDEGDTADDEEDEGQSVEMETMKAYISELENKVVELTKRLDEEAEQKLLAQDELFRIALSYELERRKDNLRDVDLVAKLVSMHEVTFPAVEEDTDTVVSVMEQVNTILNDLLETHTLLVKDYKKAKTKVFKDGSGHYFKSSEYQPIGRALNRGNEELKMTPNLDKEFKELQRKAVTKGLTLEERAGYTKKKREMNNRPRY